MQLTPTLLKNFYESPFFQKLINEREVVIDNSSYENVEACLAKGLYSYILKRKPVRNATALDFGGAFHAGLEAYYKGASISEATEVGMKYAMDRKLDLAGDPKRNVSILTQMLRHYFYEESVRPMLFKPITIEGEPMVEQSFAFPLGEVLITIPDDLQQKLSLPKEFLVRIVWTGKIDLMIRTPDGIYGVDHKTTSIMGGQFADDKLRSSQMLGYTWAGKQFLQLIGSDESMRGMIINAACSRSSGFEFKTFTLPYTAWQVDEWQKETLIALQSSIQSYISVLSTGIYIPRRTSCVSKYGKCAYFDVCQLATEPRERLLYEPHEFKTDDWSPLNEE